MSFFGFDIFIEKIRSNQNKAALVSGRGREFLIEFYGQLKFFENGNQKSQISKT